MPRLLRALAALCLCAVAASALAEEKPDPRPEARECMTRLASEDADVRRTAAERIVALGALAIDEVARGGASLDASAWDAFAAACTGKKDRRRAVALVAAAHSAPEAHRARLLALAGRIEPEAGKTRTPAEVEARVAELIDQCHRSRCGTGYDLELGLLGHDAVAPILARVQRSEGQGDWLLTYALAPIAEREDVPALGRVLLEGRTALTIPLLSLRARDVTEAEEPIYEAVEAGKLDDRLCDALTVLPDRKRSTAAALAWLEANRESATEPQSQAMTRLAEKLELREAVPAIESWVSKSKDAGTISRLGQALTRMGSRKGVDVLVHVVEERVTRFPCRPSTAAELAAASSPGRLCPDGFSDGERSDAAKILTDIAGREIAPAPKRPRDDVPDWGFAGHDQLDRAAPAFRGWWEASKDRLKFDPATGKWSVTE